MELFSSRKSRLSTSKAFPISVSVCEFNSSSLQGGLNCVYGLLRD
jgi:hypothetical protein